MEQTAEQFFKFYAEEVLGLKSLPFEMVEAQAAAPRAKLIVLDLPWPEGLANNDLFQKMMAAIGLSGADLEVIECLPGEISNFKNRVQELRSHGLPLLSFSPDLFKALDLKSSEKPEEAPALVTYGPRDLARNAGLKREAWNMLQRLKIRS